MHAKSTLVATVAAALATVVAPCVVAAADDGGGALEEVIVTAQKRPERLQDVPVAITVVSEKQLAEQHIYSITDLARTSPALEMIQAFGGPGGGGQIRGIGTNSFTRSAEGAVGIVVDGVPQGNANTNNIFDVQRIEVLRGPQGTLFGLTSSAGVINMVTNAPDPSSFKASAHVDYSDKGSTGSKYGQALVRGVINVPLTGTSALRVSASATRLEGVEDNAFTGEDNRATDVGVRARYRWSGDGGLEVNLIADYSHRTQDYADPQFVYVNVPAGTPLAAELAACGITASWANQSRCSNQSNKSSSRNYGASAQFDVPLGADNALTSITALRRNETGPEDVDIMSTPTEFTQIFATGALTTARQMSQELRLASTGTHTFDYTVGLFYSDFRATSGRETGGAFNVGTYQLAPFFINFLKQSFPTLTTNKAFAVFGQTTYHVNDRLGLIAGLRYTSQKLTDHAGANIYDPTSVAQDGSTRENNVSGKLGLQYKLTPDLMAYFTATRGYKGPQVQPAAQGAPAVVIAAEIPLAFELGIKGSLLDGRLGMDANVFSTKVKDYQGQRCGILPVGILSCNPESVDVTTRGAEFDVYGQPLEGLTLNGGIIYNIAKYPQGWTGFNPNDLCNPFVDPVNCDHFGTTSLSDAQLVGVPKTKFTLSGEYSHAFGAVRGFIGADTVYKSDLRLGPSGDARFVYPAHWITGARLGVRGPDGHWSVELFGRNLGNNHEPVTLFGGPAFTPPGVVPFLPNGAVAGISGWQTPNSLRQVGLSVDWKL
jgi:iron complex outermembrane receptor protein